MEKGFHVVINWLDELPSSHQYLIEGLKQHTIFPPYALGVDIQTQGVGSRGNQWLGAKGNLFFSFCVEEKHLPLDLPSPSISIYFSALTKEILSERGSKVWLKWPNDFYLDDKKIGGVITTKIGSCIVGSIGLNLCVSPPEFGILDIRITPYKLASLLMERIEAKIPWKKVFSNYKIEFYKNTSFTFHLDGRVVSLADAQLNDDGSIMLENKKVYSLR